MTNFCQKQSDHVVGMAGGASVLESADKRQVGTIESILRTELVAIWRRDELPLETVLERLEEMERIGWEATLEWLGHFYLFESYRDIWDTTCGEQDSAARSDDYVLGMELEDELMVEEAHDRHEMTLRSLLTSHAVAAWKRDERELERTFEIIEDMDSFGALDTWNCCEAETQIGGLLEEELLHCTEELKDKSE